MQAKIIKTDNQTNYTCRIIESHFSNKATAKYKPYQSILTQAMILIEMIPHIQKIGIKHNILPIGKFTWLTLIAMAFNQNRFGNYHSAKKVINAEPDLSKEAKQFLIDLMTLTQNIITDTATTEMIATVEQHIHEPGLGAP